MADFAILRAVEDLEKISRNGIGKPHFEDKRYAAKDFSPSNLTELTAKDKKICFVDGGSAIIIKAPNFALASHRVYYSKYNGVNREKPKLPNAIDFLSLTTSKPLSGGISYETSIYYDDKNAEPIIPKKEDLVFDSFDRTMTSGPVRADIGTVALVAREFAEWNMIRVIAENEDAEIIVRDGSLQTIKTNESKYANNAAQACAIKNVHLCGVSKTSTLLTTTGMPLLSAIKTIADNNGFESKSWYYKNIVDINHPDHNAVMFVAKLNAASQYVFRIEVSKDAAIDYSEILSGLAANSTDFTYPGYPYGLINSDVMGRVSNDEMKYDRIKTLAAASAKGISNSIYIDSKTVDAHGVLDSM
ncbi:MAG: DNA double-strand break repair nuclease NurA [Candidatus Aenigmarchaeota archaeon]|nr:DNA double-strand break repair nuclease NurA [Candidatus Aenigmarchaeota archaeon]